jgi:ribosome-binding protein aMBF1 (putative translation factor)
MVIVSIVLGYLIPWFFLRQPCTIECMVKPSPTHSGDPVLTGLGAVIRAARAKVVLSQESLAVDAELDRSYVGGIERGEHNLTLINLQKIAVALGIKPSQLLEAAGY